MTDKEKKYLDNKISLIEACVAGAILGQALFGDKTTVLNNRSRAMELIRKDIIKIYKYAKKQK